MRDRSVIACRIAAVGLFNISVKTLGSDQNVKNALRDGLDTSGSNGDDSRGLRVQQKQVICTS